MTEPKLRSPRAHAGTEAVLPEPLGDAGLRLRYLLAVVVAGAALFCLDVLRAWPRDRLPFVVALSFASALVKFLLWAGAGVLMWRLCRRVPLDRRPWHRTVGVHLAASLALVGAVALLAHGLQARLRLSLLAALPADAVGRLRDSWTGGPRMDLGASLAMSLPWDLLTYWAMLTGVAFAQGALAARDRERQAREFGGAINHAQLQVLEAQLQPHFLFNALNTVSALLARDPTAARAITRRLRDLLARLFDATAAPLQPLSADLAFLSDYVAIQRARFGDRLQVEIDVDPGCENALVPSLLLQPLVENSVRHVAARRLGTTRIRVRARRVDGQLQLDVHDDGPALASAAAPGAGLGLANTRARLRHLFGDRQGFTFAPAAPPWGGALVSIAVPTAGPRPVPPQPPASPARSVDERSDHLWLVGWVLFFAAMVVLNLIWSSARYYVYARALGASWTDVFVTGSRGAAAHVLLFPMVYAANRRLLPRVRSLSGRLALHGTFALALSLAKSTLVRGFALALGGPGAQSIVTLVGGRIYSDLLHYALIAGLAHAIERYRVARERAREAARLEAELAARLRGLRQSLDPQALFSMLSRLEDCIEQAPAEAESMIAELGDRLRQMLREGSPRSAGGEA